MAGTPISVQTGQLVHGHAVDERAEDRRLADRSRALVEQVPVEDREVGEVADGQRPGLVEGDLRAEVIAGWCSSAQATRAPKGVSSDLPIAVRS